MGVQDYQLINVCINSAKSSNAAHFPILYSWTLRPIPLSTVLAFQNMRNILELQCGPRKVTLMPQNTNNARSPETD